MVPIREIKEQLIRDLRRGMDALAGHFPADHALYNRFLSLRGDFYDLEKRYLDGLLSPTDLQIGRNRIRLAALQLLDELAAYTVDPGLGAAAFPWSDRNPFFIETFSVPDPAHPVFRTYEEEIWTAEMASGTYRLSNTTEAGAVRYHHLNIGGQDMAAFPASLEVKLEQTWPATTQPGAGLLFCFSPGQRTYYAFLLGKGGEFALWHRDSHGYNVLYSGRTDHVREEQFNRLGVIRTPQEIHLFINDQQVRQVRENRLQGGDAGLIAMGLGLFSFDNLSFYRLEV